MATAIDPVCGMPVEPQTATRSSEYEGQTYYFCSAGCKKAFEASPEQYLASEEASGGCSCCAVGR